MLQTWCIFRSFFICFSKKMIMLRVMIFCFTIGFWFLKSNRFEGEHPNQESFNWCDLKSWLSVFNPLFNNSPFLYVCFDIWCDCRFGRISMRPMIDHLSVRREFSTNNYIHFYLLSCITLSLFNSRHIQFVISDCLFRHCVQGFHYCLVVIWIPLTTCYSVMIIRRQTKDRRYGHRTS